MSVEEEQSWRRCRNSRSPLAINATNCSSSEEHNKLNSLHTSSSKVKIKTRSRIRVMPCFALLAVINLHRICAFRPSALSTYNCGTRNKFHTLTFQYIASPRTSASTVSDRIIPTDLKVQATSWMTIDSSLGSVEGKRTSTTNKNSNFIKAAGKSNTKGGGKRRKYNRKMPLSPSEKALLLSRRKRNATYEKMRLTSLKKNQAPPSIWSFDSLFPDPVFDEKSVREDLFGTKEREEELNKSREKKKRKDDQTKIGSEDNMSSIPVMATAATYESVANPTTAPSPVNVPIAAPKSNFIANATFEAAVSVGVPLAPRPSPPPTTVTAESAKSEPQNIDKDLTRMVEDRIYGYTRSSDGMSIEYATSLLDSSRAVQFREGVRLGKALSINVDRLVHFAKKDMSHGRLEEAQEFYLQAVKMDPTDGRPYLGLSRIAQRRGDLEYAKALLKEGIARSSGGFVTVRGPPEKKIDNRTKKSGKKDVNTDAGPKLGTIPDAGPNPFLLQALGTLEQKMGNLAAAEELYLQALRSRPSHAAAWVALAQLRTKELRQGAKAGRACYQSAERELQRIGAKPNAFVYTAWASMEYKKGKEDDMKSVRKSRELYRKALEADPRCSAAYLQLGVMESECGNFDTAKECFEKVLTFDQRNSRVLQAYAIMESRRPRDEVNSRRVLDLFERALSVNPRDAGVYQAYALYVVELGDIDAARDLLKRGTEVDKRHAPVWQAWGVLETRYNTAKVARDIFQQGIWSCAQSGGGQSGGRRCARLWQAWGVLEAQEGDHAAARRCFSRALDADQRNVAAVTAWALMEEDLGNFSDARSIFERTLKYFSSPSDDKTAVWRAYEIMEDRAGNYRKAQQVFQRSMREEMASKDEEIIPERASDVDIVDSLVKNKSKEVEVSRWQTGSSDLGAEVWLNNGSIEGKIPAKMMKKLRNGDSSKGR